MIGAAARWFDDVDSALSAEALAAREGLELALELGLDKVVLEVDCQGLVHLLHDPEAVYSSIGSLCLDIIELGKSFSEFFVGCGEMQTRWHMYVLLRSLHWSGRFFGLM